MNDHRIVRHDYNYRLAASNLNASLGIAVVTVLRTEQLYGEHYKIQNLRGFTNSRWSCIRTDETDRRYKQAVIGQNSWKEICALTMTKRLKRRKVQIEERIRYGVSDGETL